MDVDDAGAPGAAERKIGPRVPREALVDAWHRSAHQRVEIACRGGRGRHYHRRAVETPGQRRFVQRFRAPLTPV